ncbi:MAG: hypothetical protein ACYC4D_05055 [Thermoleophilia bacterium]
MTNWRCCSWTCLTSAEGFTTTQLFPVERRQQPAVGFGLIAHGSATGQLFESLLHVWRNENPRLIHLFQVGESLPLWQPLGLDLACQRFDLVFQVGYGLLAKVSLHQPNRDEPGDKQ